MFRRRRPLLRAAVVGGGAYVAGKKVAQHSADQSAQESGQDTQHESGSLDDAEFSAAKRKLLGI